jgi:hypothetical protein
MKYIIILVIGAAVGGIAVKYHDNAEFRSEANAHIDAAVSQGATAAHTALQSAETATK